MSSDTTTAVTSNSSGALTELSPQFTRLFAMHQFHLVPLTEQNLNNLALVESAFEPEAWRHLTAIGAQHGDHIEIARKEEKIPREAVEKALKALNLPTDDQVMMLTNFALNILGPEMTEFVRWNDDYTALLANYTHHGILLADGHVIQFATTGDWTSDEVGSIHKHPFATFWAKSDIRGVKVVSYESAAPRLLTAKIAESIVEVIKTEGLQCGYAPLKNNCEHLATSLRTGKHISQQIQALQAIVNKRKNELTKKILNAAAVSKPVVTADA